MDKAFGTDTGTAAGDFDNDGDVDGRDFLVWQRSSGDSDGRDFLVWQRHYGSEDELDLVDLQEPPAGEPATSSLFLGDLF